MINVYLICAEFQGQKLYKIGYTKRAVELRIKEIRTGNGHDIYLVDSFQSKWGTKIEAQLHKYFSSKKVNREWFSLNDNEIELFRQRCESIDKTLNLIAETNTYFMEKGKFY